MAALTASIPTGVLPCLRAVFVLYEWISEFAGEFCLSYTTVNFCLKVPLDCYQQNDPFSPVIGKRATEMVDESALACLEEAVMRLADTNESDEELGDNMSVYDEGHEEGENDASSLGRSYAPTQSVFPGVPKANAAPMVSLSKIMADGHSFQLFRRFLKDQCISRNLNFWLTCEAYRTQAHESNMERRTEIAKSIYMKFLKSSAPLHVNILDQTRRDISLAIRLVDPSPQLFDDAQQEVYEMMEANEFRQFLCSDTFSECSLFSQGDGDTLLNGRMPLGFRPAMYRGGSLHSGSDDTTSVTSFTSE